MAIENAFKCLMTQTITVEPFTSVDGYAQPAFGTGVEYTCRTVDETNVVRDVENKERVSTAKTWVFGSPGLSPKDRVTLPSGEQPPILQIKKYPDENGAHHEVIFT